MLTSTATDGMTLLLLTNMYLIRLKVVDMTPSVVYIRSWLYTWEWSISYQFIRSRSCSSRFHHESTAPHDQSQPQLSFWTRPCWIYSYVAIRYELYLHFSYPSKMWTHLLYFDQIRAPISGGLPYLENSFVLADVNLGIIFDDNKASNLGHPVHPFRRRPMSVRGMWFGLKCSKIFLF